MTARILVVDDIPANVKLLEARLLAEYFEVLTAYDGQTALDICSATQVDVILLDIMMPGMDGFEVCERLKANAKTAHIPVVMVTALDQPEDRVRGLNAGADDFLTKPVNDLQLMARVKSLVRLKSLTDELRLRALSAHSIEEADILRLSNGPLDEPGQVLLIDERAQSQERIVRALRDIADVQVLSDPQAAVFEAADRPYELVIVGGNFSDFDPLRLCSQLRSVERTRYIPVLILVEPESDQMIARAMELGVNDYLIRPLDPNELVARTVTQIRRKRFNDKLRRSVRESIELAVTDGLTGLSNRRYLDKHLNILVGRALARKRPLTVCMTDIDRFKSVNDTFGHDAGDEILRQFSQRIRGAVRGADLACRFGGEEFAIIMPDTLTEDAYAVAERLRASIESEPFLLNKGQKTLNLTVSIGIATIDSEGETPESLLKRADLALYEAKENGRNQVIMTAA